jgi:hypothetical protein
MSLLPQRKKSPEEIARLRDSLGVPGAPRQEEETQDPSEPPAGQATEVDTIVASNHEAALVHQAETIPLAPQPAEPPSGPKPVHSLKRSERLPRASATAVPDAAPSAVTLDVRSPKPIRSLRKSEQIPSLPYPESPPDSNLPHQRHSENEIMEIRRREVLAMMNAQPDSRLFPAHPALIVPGYLATIVAAVGLYFYEFSIAATLACVTASLLVAAFIGIRKPISRHHAAFIAVIALFVLIFGALHYFPQLRHAT